MSLSRYGAMALGCLFAAAPVAGTKPALASGPATEAFHGAALVTARHVLNFRAGPGVAYKDLGNLPHDAKVEVLARTKAAFAVAGYQGSYRWYQVRYQGRTGWSWGAYLKVAAAPAHPPALSLPSSVGGRAIEKFSGAGTVFARELNVRVGPMTSAREIGELKYGAHVKIHARTVHRWWVQGYTRGFRWYLVEAGRLRGWSWGGFISVGGQTPPQRRPGGGERCDPRDPHCNSHNPGGRPRPEPGPVVPSAGADISIFPVAGQHWSWNHKACGYNDYYRSSTSSHANGHIGNDIMAKMGTPIVAPVAGEVIRAGYSGEVGGNRVTIRRGNWSFYHAHLKAVARGIVAGKHVKAGDVIGYLGDSGSARGCPHLHFSIYPGDNYQAGVNPYPHLKKVDPQCR